jgi:predicted RNase H-like HicB family nuclease
MDRRIDRYTMVIWPDDNGTFVAEVPAIDGCHAWGRTADEARAELPNVFDMITDEFAERGQPLPPDPDHAAAVSR